MVSAHVGLEYLAPEGVDGEAFRAVIAEIQSKAKSPTPCVAENIEGYFLHHAEFLGRFPTSTYSAYTIYGRMKGTFDVEQDKFMRSLETGAYLSNSYPDETGKSKDGWRWLKDKEAADWWAKWYDIILKNHPDIWFADELRLKRAVDQIALKNYQGADAELAALAKDPKSPMQAKAQVVLGLMKQKGWIKD